MATKNIIRYISIIAILFGILSCTPYKRIKYLQTNYKNNADSVVHNENIVKYLVRPHDLLYIKIIGLDDKTALFFNTNTHTQNYESIRFRLYFESYLVNDSGTITMPIIGTIKVAGYTINEITKIIDNEIKKYLISGSTIIRLSNNQVTILGEVLRPGVHELYLNKINFFQVIGMAGDFTVNANLKKIMIVRNHAPNQYSTHYIDITNRKFLESEYFYVLPGDIIYVEPVRSKQFATNPFSITTILSAITTLLLLYGIIK